MALLPNLATVYEHVICCLTEFPMRSTGLCLAVALTLSTGALAQDAMKVREAKFPVAETADRLAKALEEKGIKVAARVDHAAGAKAAGMELSPTVVLMFGNPKLGTPLMQADPRAGLDLPMRVLVWQDKAGKTMVGYAAPSGLAQRYDLKGEAVAQSLKAMEQALENFTKAAAGSE